VTYDEVLRMVRRFKNGRGRVEYAGPLLALLEAPNVKALEKQLIRVLTKAEGKGTSLDRAFAYFDADGGGTVSVIELEDALRALGCFRGTNSGAVSLVLQRFDVDKDGVISLHEFISYIRKKQALAKPPPGRVGGPVKGVDGKVAGSALQARVKAILLQAESLGVSVVDAFQAFDGDGSGALDEDEFAAGLYSLGTFAKLPRKEVSDFFRLRDVDNSGAIELDELLRFMGRDYLDHVVLKLTAILDGVERRGTRVADAFAAWDCDGGGSLSREELTSGLKSLGIFREMTPGDVDRLLDKIDADRSGQVEIREFYAFVGRDFSAFLKARFRNVLATAALKFNTPLDGAFREWDTDKSGTISTTELRIGLDSLEIFRGFNEADARQLLASIDHDSSGQVSLKELAGFCGVDFTAILARRLRCVLLAVENKGTSLNAVFLEWDSDKSGAISLRELSDGVSALGTFGDLKADGSQGAEVEKLVRLFDLDGDGLIAFREVERFMGRDRVLALELKLRQVIHTSGIDAREAFAHFDADASGDVTRFELAAGLRALPGFEDVSDVDAVALAKLYDVDGDGSISASEFVRQVGAPEIGEAETALLKLLRSQCSEKNGLSFAKWSESCRKAMKNPPSPADAAAALEAALKAAGCGGGHGGMCGHVAQRFGTAAAIIDFSRRGGVGTPDELAELLGEPSANPTPRTGEGVDPALQKFAQLLITFEDGGGNLKHAFARLDADGGGSITAMELFSGLIKLGTVFADLQRADAHAFVKALDHDGDNSIDFGELCAFVKEERKARAPSENDVASRLAAVFLAFEDGGGDLADAFARLDSDGDGAIDAAELYQGLRKLGTAFSDTSQADAANAIAILDKGATKDGRLDLAELRAFVNSKRLAFEAGKAAKSKPGGTSKAARHLRAVLRRVEASGTCLRDAFDAFDVDRSGSISPAELFNGLERIGGDDLFRGADSAAIEKMVRDEFDTDGDGQVDLQELLQFVRNEDTFDPAPAASDQVTKAKLRAVLLTTEKKKGTSLTTVFEAFDADGSGSISVGELLRALRKLGVFKDVDPAAVESLVHRELDADGSGIIQVGEFLTFARGGGSEHGQAVVPKLAAKDDSDDDDILVSAEYDFSLDADTRCIEKKLRRAARELAARGGDVRLLFEQYDFEKSGSVIRSEFVQVLMQLGLSLVDDPCRGPDNSGERQGDAVRQRQMQQLALVRGPHQRRLQRTAGEAGGIVDDWDELALVKWYREGAKREMVRGLLAKSMVSSVAIFPAFGETLWWEHEIHNPFSRAERFAVVLSGGEKHLRCVTSAEEWSHLRKHVRPCCGTVDGSKPVERDMLDASSSTPMVLLMPHETVRIPFAYLSLEPPSHDLRWGSATSSSNKNESKQSEDGRSCSVQFVAGGGYVVAALQVEVKPRPCVVDRTFRFYQPEGEILKRCVRVMPTQPAAGIGAPSSSLIHSLGGARQSHGGSAGMYVHCVSTDAGAAADVALQWKESAQVPGAHDVLIKYARTPAFPGVGEFYVLVFRDRFCAQVAELWHVVVHSRLRADVNCVAGQSAGVELVVRGDRAPRVVRAYAQAAGGDVSQTCSFDPPGNFRLVPNAHNKFAIHYRSSQAGAQRVHVHLVDVDSKELVGAWLLTAVSAAPQITKTYDVELPVGAASTKRIPYRNPWDRARAFSLVSSDEAVCKPRDGGDRLQIPPNGTEYLRLFFPAMRRGLHQVFLFVNDEHDQSEDVFLLRLIVA